MKRLLLVVLLVAACGPSTTSWSAFADGEAKYAPPVAADMAQVTTAVRSANSASATGALSSLLTDLNARARWLKTVKPDPCYQDIYDLVVASTEKLTTASETLLVGWSTRNADQLALGQQQLQSALVVVQDLNATMKEGVSCAGNS